MDQALCSAMWAPRGDSPEFALKGLPAQERDSHGRKLQNMYLDICWALRWPEGSS